MNGCVGAQMERQQAPGRGSEWHVGERLDGWMDGQWVGR